MDRSIRSEPALNQNCPAACRAVCPFAHVADTAPADNASPSPLLRRTLNVALVGNPNTGKSTLFSALVGVRQRVGNYPGVTIEKRTGQMEYQGCEYQVTDLPGLYSLAPHSRDEAIAVDVLLGDPASAPPIDAVISIVDASNLERNLYLVSQTMELGLPMVVALNMLDVAESRAVTIDVQRLQEELGIRVVPTQANRRIGVERLKMALAEAVEDASRPRPVPFPEPLEQEAAKLEPLLADHLGGNFGSRVPLRWLARRLLLDADGYLCEALAGSTADGRLRDTLHAARDRLQALGCHVPAVETEARYAWAAGILQHTLVQPDRHPLSVSDRIDRLLAHRLWGTLVFAVVMILVFQSVFTWARPLVELIDGATGILSRRVEAALPAGAARSLLTDGVIGGVGSVLTFLPQILVLFLFIGLLEDCGYMARAAFLMDRLMARVGLSGKAFIPLISSCACAIPGIMATRVIHDRRDRLATILVAPLMPCSARLPIYTLLIAAFVPQRTYARGLLNLQGLTLAGLYLLGIVAAAGAALVLKRTLLRGPRPPLLLELPSYKWPSARTILHRVVERGWLFVRCAGTMILLVSILAWAALHYPHNAKVVEAPFYARQQALRTQLNTLPHNSPQRATAVAQMADLDREIVGAYQRQSVLGRLGRFIEPAVRPLGWDWRIGCAVIASFPAREIVVASLGVIFNAGEDAHLKSPEGMTRLQAELRQATRNGTARPLFTLPVALSLLVFYALCAQCAATLIVIRRETNSWRWPLATFAYMTALAYTGAMATYQVAAWLAM